MTFNYRSQNLSLWPQTYANFPQHCCSGLQTPDEEIAFTARPKIKPQSNPNRKYRLKKFRRSG